eukprot:TRINITY_DN85_c0_g3_i2.p2 TRINITY_DN85_c0_g3~~TRINITY_DN85_c0_g3_i2.p2  ORF type:complete len:270 (+),score=51.83 TRINITY_DN85_c0_g3_i2:74-811(+)
MSPERRPEPLAFCHLRSPWASGRHLLVQATGAWKEWCVKTNPSPSQPHCGPTPAESAVAAAGRSNNYRGGGVALCLAPSSCSADSRKPRAVLGIAQAAGLDHPIWGGRPVTRPEAVPRQDPPPGRRQRGGPLEELRWLRRADSPSAVGYASDDDGECSACWAPSPRSAPQWVRQKRPVRPPLPERRRAAWREALGYGDPSGAAPPPNLDGPPAGGPGGSTDHRGTLFTHCASPARRPAAPGGGAP